MNQLEETDFSPLDNPVWHAISGPQAHLAECSPGAGRYRPDVSPFGGISDPSELASLAKLMTPKETVLLASPATAAAPSDIGFELLMSVPVHQMRFSRPPATPPVDRSKPEIVPLGDNDSKAMVALATLTEPGPFATETHRLGHYYGVFQDDALVAMAGERFTLPGFVEVSGVCTHPTARGRGYAALLVEHLANEIHSRGDTPFLHVRIGSPSEQSAVGVYERVGFVHHQQVMVHVIRRL